MKTKVTITHFLDNDATTPVVSVPLINSEKPAVLYQSDFNDLIRLGLNPCWKVAAGQVFEKGRSNISIARLVANAQPGEKIQYKDRDPFNLRLNNLVTSVGAGKWNEREKLLTREHAILKQKAELDHFHKLPSWELANSSLRE